MLFAAEPHRSAFHVVVYGMSTMRDGVGAPHPPTHFVVPGGLGRERQALALSADGNPALSDKRNLLSRWNFVHVWVETATEVQNWSGILTYISYAK